MQPSTIKSQASTYSKRTRRITSRSPAPTSVQAETLVLDNLEHTTAAESLGVRLTLDLEHIQGQQDDLADTDQTTSSGVHDGLSGLLAEHVLELGAVVLTEEVPGNGLTTVLVYPLQNLVSGGVSQTGEEGDELLGGAGVGLVAEDDGVELLEVVDL
jgi:hypothetical protein